MRTLNMTVFTATALIIAAWVPCNAGTNTNSSAVQELGVTDGKPITNGFVFIDGKYLDPPYVVTRQGNGIFINGNMVEQPCPWPIPPAVEREVPTEEVPMPKAITNSTTKYDKELQKYVGLRKAYYFSRYPKAEALERVAKTYAEMPCVRSAHPSKDPELLDVTWANGEESHIRLILPERSNPMWSRESILARLDKDRANYEERLGKGDFYFLGSHSRITGTADGARMTLPVLLPILKTSKDAKEVQQRLQQAGISLSMDQKGCELFFANRTDSKALTERVEALTKDKAGK